MRTTWAQFLPKVEIEYRWHTSVNNKKSIKIGSQLYIIYYSYSIHNNALVHCCSRRVTFQSRTKRNGQQHLVLTIKMQSCSERTRGRQVSHCFISHLKIVIASLLNEEFQHFAYISSFLVESAVSLKGTSSGLDSPVYIWADNP